MNKLSYILTAVLATLCPLLLFSQSQTKDLSSLPQDPRVKSGKLSNGLSYIIIKNQSQKSTATFCVAQKVGTSLEAGSSRGSFMLLQQLATKGTRNFEGSAIPDYLRTLGLGTDNLFFSTGVDRITYTIKDVPIARSNTIDSALLILYNWMSSINVDESDIAPERSTLAQRILGGWTPKRRMEYDLMRRLYPDSPYTNMLEPSAIKSISSINSRDLRSFYYNWCRPELQCVIVVGDVDPAKLETQVKSVFSTIPKPIKSTKRVWYEPKPFNGVKTFVMQDHEFEKTLVSIDLLKQPLKDNYRQTNLPYILDFMDEASLKLLRGRIEDGLLRETIPVYNLSVSKGKFMGIEKSSSIGITFETLPESVYSAISFVSAQIKKLADKGVDSKEFDKAVDVYWKELEAFYDNRLHSGNDIYLERALAACYDGYSLASTEMKFEIMKGVLFSLDSKQLSSYMAAAFNQEDNIVISCFLPKASGVNRISEERLLAAYSQPLDKALVSGESSVPVWPSITPEFVSTVVSETEDPQTQSKVVVLSNGATLVFKDIPGASDTLFFRAVSKGGFSLVRGASAGNQEYYNGLLAVGSTSDISYTNMSRLYAFNHLGLSSRIDQNTEQMEGFCAPPSAEKLMQAIYLNMTDRRGDPAAFDIYKKKVLYDLKYNSLSPQAIFRDTVAYYRNSNKQFVRRNSEEQIKASDNSAIHRTLSSRFDNAADFVFIFAGGRASDYKDLAVKYIGGIKGNPQSKENWLVVPNYIAKGRQERRFLVKMSVPRSYVSLTFSSSKNFNSKNRVLGQLLESYVDVVFRQDLYTSVPLYNVHASLDYYPEQIFALDVIFETDSSSVQSNIQALAGKLNSCAKGNISQQDFDALKRHLEDRYSSRVGSAGFWLEAIEAKYMYGADFSSEPQVLSAVTKSDFSKFVKELMSSNRITVVMDGTTADIPTLQLLQENEFIRDFFDVK